MTSLLNPVRIAFAIGILLIAIGGTVLFNLTIGAIYVTGASAVAIALILYTVAAVMLLVGVAIICLCITIKTA